jgi:hypothetical protein
MGKITGFLEIERHDRVYAPVELVYRKPHPARNAAQYQMLRYAA